MKILIAVATYNEVENVASLIEQIHHYAPSAHVLFLDDNSPDGTGELLEKIKLSDPKLYLIHRSGKLGLGSAHLAMMDFFLAHPACFDFLITMDSDFSHHPKYLPTMINMLTKEVEDKKVFVTGSRYVEGGRSGYGLYRHLISITANFLTKLLLRIPLKECTTAYRGYSRKLVQQFRTVPILSNGYSFFVESLFVMNRFPKICLEEFPIIFEDRTKGKSKINKKEILYGVLTLLRLFKQRVTS